MRGLVILNRLPLIKMIAYIDEHSNKKLELEDIAKNLVAIIVAYTSQFFKRQWEFPLWTMYCG